MLLQNQTVFAQMPLRRRGGVGYDDRALFGRSERRNIFVGGVDQIGGVPNGHLAPSSWNLPAKAGGISSYTSAKINFVGVANGAQGLNLSGSTSFSFTSTGDGAAVAAAIGSSTITFTVSGTMSAPLSASGSSSFSFTAVGGVQGIAALTGSTTFEITSTLSTRALGFMTAVPIDISLTADTIAEAVWDRLASQHTSIGTFGATLSSAQKAAKLAAVLSA